jgi:hypothetical protein
MRVPTITTPMLVGLDPGLHPERDATQEGGLPEEHADPGQVPRGDRGRQDHRGPRSEPAPDHRRGRDEGHGRDASEQEQERAKVRATVARSERKLLVERNGPGSRPEAAHVTHVVVGKEGARDDRPAPIRTTA